MVNIVDGSVFTATTVIAYPNGGRLAWSSVHNLLAFDQAINNQWEIRTCDGNGGNQTTLTVGLEGLPNGHRGNPAWSPNGNWILFQAATYQEDLSLPGFATPGLGVAGDVYIMSYPGLVVTRLTDVGDASGGVLHAHFNAVGDKIWWAQKETGVPDGRWFIAAADFSVVEDVPTLTNLTHYKPRGDGLYETHWFDSTYALFTHSAAGTSTEPGLNVYRVSGSDFTSSPVKIAGATAGGTDQHWDEHGHFNPAGTHIFYMTSRLTGVVDPFGGGLKTDIVMIPTGTPTADGTQVTDFDNPAHGTYQPDVEQPVAGDFAFNGETELFVYCFPPPTLAEYLGQTTRPGLIVKITAVS